MRTTLDIDPEILGVARSLAAARGTSVGKALSLLARKGAAAQTPTGTRNGFGVFLVSDVKQQSFGPEDVAAALDAEDRARGSSFAGSAREE